MTIRFTILQAQSSDNPSSVSFSPNGGHVTGEGLTVKFESPDFVPWIGVFRRETNTFDKVIHHPNGKHVIVVAGGMAYIIDPCARKVLQELGGCFTFAELLTNHRAVLFGSNTDFEAFRDEQLWWNSPRISWDGFKNIRIVENELLGEAYSAIDETWHPFTLDIRSGKCTNAVYPAQARALVPLNFPQ